MKKVFLKIVSVFVLLAIVGSMAACDGENSSQDGDTAKKEQAKLVSFGAGMLKDCYVDITDKDTSLAIEQRTNESVDKNNKGYLVAFDDENKKREVKFIYGDFKNAQEADGEEDSATERIEITQEELKASLANIFVTKKFTYLTFVPIGHNVESDYYYNMYYRYTANSVFLCDDKHQSFIMDNETHKLYPTNGLGVLTQISETYVKVAKGNGSNSYDFSKAKYHELTIDNDDNLVLTKVIPNDNIVEESIAVDKFGNVFVKNSSVNKTDGKYLYYTQSSNTMYFIGADGHAYSALETGKNESFCIEINRFESDLSSKPIPEGMTLKGPSFLIKNNKLYSLNFTSSIINQYKPMEPSSRLSRLDIVDGKAIWGDSGNRIYHQDFKFYIIGEEIFLSLIVDGNNTLYYYDTKTGLFNQYIDTFLKIDYSGNIPVLTKELLDGTQKFMVVMHDGVAVSEMFEDVENEGSIVTIQPLK